MEGTEGLMSDPDSYRDGCQMSELLFRYLFKHFTNELMNK
jgi:hypothetical protein